MLIMFTYSFFTQDNSENVSQDQTEAEQDFEPEIDPKRVPFYKVLQLLLLFAFFLFGFGVFFISCSFNTHRFIYLSINLTIHWTGIRQINSTIHWIEILIYPKDSVTHRINHYPVDKC